MNAFTKWLTTTLRFISLKVEDILVESLVEIQAWKEKTVRYTWTTIAFITALIILAFVMGLIKHDGIYMALVGVFIAFMTIFLMLWWTPIPILFGVADGLITDKKSIDTGKRNGETWLKFVLVVILWELLLCFFCSRLPYWLDINTFLRIVIITIIIAVMGAVWGSFRFTRGLIQAVVVLYFIVLIMKLCCPQTTGAIGNNYSDAAASQSIQNSGTLRGMLGFLVSGAWKPNTDKYWGLEHLDDGSSLYSMKMNGGRVPFITIEPGRGVKVSGISNNTIQIHGFHINPIPLTLTGQEFWASGGKTLDLEVSGYSQGDQFRIIPLASK